MNAAGPGAAGTRRRSRRDAPRPSTLTRERSTTRPSTLTRERSTTRPSTLTQERSAPGSPRPARTWWPWLVAGTAMLTLTAVLTWVVLGSALFAARSVQVVGARELPAEVVRAVAAVRLGTPMMRLDTTAIAARVAAVPRVASVQVRCDLDGTVRVEVTERTPIAFVRRANGVHLVDATGTDYAVVPVGPPGLPELRLARVGPRDAATVAALAVLTGLPQWLRVQVRSVTAKSPAGVMLGLRQGWGSTAGWGSTEREVRWGDAGQGDRKAAVLGPLLTQPGKIYDVSSPTLPTIT